MADVDERLDCIEQALSTTNTQLGEVKGQLDKHDERFNQVDERLNQVDERFDQVDERFDRMDKRIDSLASDVHKLRMLREADSDQIKLIAEVQSRHGEKLNEIATAIEPLKDLRDFVERVADDHERRITALENKGA